VKIESNRPGCDNYSAVRNAREKRNHFGAIAARPTPQPFYDAYVIIGVSSVVLAKSNPVERNIMKALETLSVKLFADGADKAGMLEMYALPHVKGFTTNPSLMRKAGIRDYAAFAQEIVAAIPDRSLSFEVFSDEFAEMERQAHLIRSWGDNVYVKIPVTNSKGESSAPLIARLARANVKQNVTALMTLAQVREVVAALADGPSAYVSVFAGRIADTGRDPVPLMAAAVELLRLAPQLELIWASPRELLNVFQAAAVGCHIITATNDILKKLALIGKNLSAFSLETVATFKKDAESAGFSL
jgi:transaldolase